MVDNSYLSRLRNVDGFLNARINDLKGKNGGGSALERIAIYEDLRNELYTWFPELNPERPVLDNLEQLKVSEGVRRAFRLLHIDTPEQLGNTSEVALRRISGVGPAKLWDLRKELAKYGIQMQRPYSGVPPENGKKGMP